jgi:hypothetical protein
MEMVENGTIRSGQIVLAEPIGLPDGTAVVVHVEPVGADASARERAGDFKSLAFFGMWANRQDFADGATWVERERDRWPRYPRMD